MTKSPFTALLVGAFLSSSVALAMNTQEQERIPLLQESEVEIDLSDRAKTSVTSPSLTLTAGSQSSSFNFDFDFDSQPSSLGLQRSSLDLMSLPEPKLILCLTFLSSDSGSNVSGLLSIMTVSKGLKKFAITTLTQVSELVWNGSQRSINSRHAFPLLKMVQALKMGNIQRINLNRLKVNCSDISNLEGKVVKFRKLELLDCSLENIDQLFSGLARHPNLEDVSLTACGSSEPCLYYDLFYQARSAELVNLKGLRSLRKFDASTLLGPDLDEPGFKGRTGFEGVIFIEFSNLLEAQGRIRLANSGVDRAQNYRQALRLAHADGNLGLQAQAKIGLANCGVNQRFHAADALYMGESIRDNHLQCQALVLLGKYYEGVKSYQEAKDYLIRATKLCTESQEKEIQDSITRVDEHLKPGPSCAIL